MSQITEMQVESSAAAIEGDDVELSEVVGRLSDADARAVDADLTRMASLASAPALNAVERASFPRVVIEKTPLDEGVPVVYRDFGNGVWRIAYDPEQFSRQQLETLINIYVAGSGAYVERSVAAHMVLRHVDKVRLSDMRAEAVALWDAIERAVIASEDPGATLTRICDRVIAESDVIKAERLVTS